MQNIAGWIAPIATMIAAMMTAANLGTRITGWGFVIFAVGAVAWIVVAAMTGQTNLLISNLLLALVDLVGIWRWLGVRARSEDAADAASDRGGGDHHGLLAATRLEGMKIAAPDGATVGHIAAVMLERNSGRIDHLIVRVGGAAGIGESLRRLDWSRARMGHDRLQVGLDADAMQQLPCADSHA